MDLDLLLVRSFVVLADEGDRRAAAGRLGITASALSKRLHRLETQLGVAVTTRTVDGITITPAGRRFLPYARDLLSRAHRARAAAHATPVRATVRVGLPAGARASFIDAVGMRAAARTLTGITPELRVSYHGVPFPALRDCLPAGRVDVLWTNSPVRHPGVDTLPVPVTTDRIGVVGPEHALADATEISASEFAGQPILYNPQAPEEWMTPYWLGDIRSRPDAQLVPIDARDCDTIYASTGHPDSVLVMGAIEGRHLPPTARTLTLIDANPIVLHIATRRNEPSAAVRILIQLLLQQLAVHLS